jgi:ABC-type glycerol-3-phosphate transport system permease component
VAAVPAVAQQTRPETYIKWRQSVYQVMVWNAARIRNNLDGPQYSREEVVKAAGLISAQRPIDWNVAATVGVVTIIPIFIFSLFIERYIVRGITAGAVR